MPGVRIQAADPALADCEVILPDPSRTITRDGKIVGKPYHFRLDAAASTIVSETVWSRLQWIMAHASGCPRFYAVGEVARPPSQGVGHSAPDMRPAVELRAGSLIPVGLRPQPHLGR